MHTAPGTILMSLLRTWPEVLEGATILSPRLREFNFPEGFVTAVLQEIAATLMKQATSADLRPGRRGASGLRKVMEQDLGHKSGELSPSDSRLDKGLQIRLLSPYRALRRSWPGKTASRETINQGCKCMFFREKS